MFCVFNLFRAKFDGFSVFFTKLALKTGTNVSKTLDFHYILLNMWGCDIIEYFLSAMIIIEVKFENIDNPIIDNIGDPNYR